MQKSLHPFIFLLIWTISLQAQIYNFRNFSYDDGLTHSEVYALCEGKNGNLWIGTLGGGLLKFDGYSFTSYLEESGLVNNFIRSLLIDEIGNLWIGTEAGLCIYNGIEFFLLDSANGPGDFIITALLQDINSTIWIGTSENGLFRLDSLGFSNFTTDNGLADNSINCLFEAPDSSIWIGTNKGATRFKENRFTSLTRRNGLPSSIVRGISCDYEENIWFATYNGGVSRYNGDSLINFSAGQGLNSRRVYSIIKDINGNMWFGTDRGVTKFNGKDFKLFNESNGLSSNIVVSLFQDSSGSIWFGTSGGGLSRLDSERFIHYPENDKLGRRIFSVIQAINGNMIFGSSEGGITVFDGHQYSLVKGTRGFTSSKVQALYYAPDSTLWIGTIDDGAFEFDRDGFHKYTYENGLASNNISGFATDTAGNMWIATLDSGVCVLPPDTNSITRYSIVNGLGSNTIYTMLADSSGNIWLGAENGGLNKIQLKSDFDPSPVIIRYTTDSGLSSNSIKSIIMDSLGTLFLGTAGGGINILSDTSIIVINKSSGIYSNNIYSLILDDQDRLWAGTERGVDRITFGSNYTITEYIHFGRNEGFRGIDNYRNASCLDDEGNIWFGTINGIVRYNPVEDIIIEHKPITHLSRIKLFFRNIEETEFTDSLTAWYPIPAFLKLPYNKNNLTFEFVGINLRNPEGIQYRWKLEGFDEDWTPPVKQREVTFSNLQPGEYSFKVITGNEMNQWNEEPVSFTFTISPPVWKEVWFKTAVILTVLLLISLIIYSQFRRIKIKNRIAQERLELEKNIIELEQEAARLQMNPHFIFNSLNSIQGFIASNEPFQAKRYLAKFARLMRLILENAREEFIPLQNEIDILENYLELEKLRTNDKFDFRINVKNTIDTENVDIPPMMIQPFVENAIVHGIIGKNGRGKIVIDFSKNENSLYCQIIDDGIGRQQAQKNKLKKSPGHKSTGISVTLKRLEQMKMITGEEAGVVIEDLMDNGHPRGTKVTIRIPFESF